MDIIKRNGNIVPFDINKIINAVKKAIKETKGEENNQLATIVANIVTAQCKDKIEVEEIQDLVIKTLLGLGETDIATHYISYRATQTYKRNMALEKLYNKMEEIVEFGDNENSNKNYKLPSVKRDTIAGEYFRENIFTVLPKELAEAHKNKAIHWHDADVDPKLTNCCLFNIEDMLANGTRINNADIESPKSVVTAMNIGTQIMASISASQYGGNSLPNFNEVFAKYAKMNFKKNFIKIYNVKHDANLTTDKFEEITGLKIDSGNKKLEHHYPNVFLKTKEWTKKDIYDGCQLFEYQINSVLGSAS